MEATHADLTLNDYQQFALRTMADPTYNEKNIAVLSLGLTGESGEFADNVKKVLGHGHQLDKDKLIKELGDVLWYAAGLATVLGVSLGEVAQRNVDKLKARYPEGFSSERSINRTDS